MNKAAMSLVLVVVLILAMSSIVGVSGKDGSQRRIIARCGEGYLEEDTQENRIIHLKGSPYEIGYQQGYMLSEGVEVITKDFVDKILFTMMGLDISGQDLGVMWNLIRGLILELSFASEEDIPEEYRIEMQGVADGATDAGADVAYEDVLLLNEAIDVLMGTVYFLAFTLGEVISIPFFIKNLKYAWDPISVLSIPELKLGISLPACNQFAIFGGGTTDGRLFHGRDFMFNTCGILQDYTLMRVAEPDEGYPFIGVTAAGFVGVWGGMNIKGISIGTNMAPSRDCVPFKGGEGTLFVCRDVVQYASTLDEAIELVKNAPRYVSCNYLVADGKIPDAVALETTAHVFEVREAKDTYKDQIEDKPDLVIAINHYIHPKMKLLDRGICYYGLITMSGGGLDSEWRYEHMCDDLLDNYSQIDVDKAREIIDMLHPPNYEYLEWEYHQFKYTDDPTQEVSGAISVFDPSNLEVWSLYGYYDNPWVHYSLEEELGMA